MVKKANSRPRSKEQELSQSVFRNAWCVLRIPHSLDFGRQTLDPGRWTTSTLRTPHLLWLFYPARLLFPRSVLLPRRPVEDGRSALRRRPGRTWF